MKQITVKQLWFFPLLFGILGAFIGLILRYAFTGSITDFPFKFVLHSHSHVMLLGFIFNALIVLLFTRFTNGIDTRSYQLYIALQVCVSVMLVMFIIQGYAFVTILFSTLHLWISYVLLIRLWKRLQGEKSIVNLIKIGIVFHFISSIGPYTLGPLMALEMQDSPWYQQAIFFYLHFQYFGSFFLWMLAVLLKKTGSIISKKQQLFIVISVSLLYAHSLDFSFNNSMIQLAGSIGSVLLFIVLSKFKTTFSTQSTAYKFIFGIILLIGLLNCIGSTTFMADLVSENRFVLIAWLHLLFLGMYTPFIWIETQIKISKILWVLYAFFIIFSESLLMFPSIFSEWFSTSIMWLLFIAYFGVFLCISVVHLTSLFSKEIK